MNVLLYLFFFALLSQSLSDDKDEQQMRILIIGKPGLSELYKLGKSDISERSARIMQKNPTAAKNIRLCQIKAARHK